MKPDGSFDAQDGRVEIRYKATDSRAYRAAERNLERIPGEEILPDDTCVEGQEVEKQPSKQARSEARKADAAAKALAPGAVPSDAWTVYADGACSGNPGPAGLGIVLVAPGGKSQLEGYEYLGTATNNVAELTAILRAAEIVPAEAPFVLHTDSQYSIGVLTKGWKAKANQELIASVKAALARRKDYRIVYVPGHAGVPLNERADELAREAVARRSSRLPTIPEGAQATG
ncbi:MAG TPA: ribonuclease H [Labilithrix sp.]|nr:ribonuclease H [Labilithrix sp.]